MIHSIVYLFFVLVFPSIIIASLEDNNIVYWKVSFRGAEDDQCLIVPDQPNCITSNMYGTYDNFVLCIFQTLIPGRLRVVDLNIEEGFDGFLYENGILLDNESQINNITLMKDNFFIWDTDFSVTRSGWTICLDPTVPDCCTNNFGECLIDNDYCNANQKYCENDCDGYWFPVNEDDDTCIPRFEPCTSSNDCCPGVVCLKDENDYIACGLNGTDGTPLW